jgi:hypothetical protein
MIRTLLLAILLAAPVIAGPRDGPVTDAATVKALEVRDAELFDVIFNSCDTAKLPGLIADDFEFYHDKDGLSSTRGAQFIAGISATCARQKSGEDYRARRKIVPGSVQVYVLNNYGAIQTGQHRFYGVGGKLDGKLIETATFFDVWKNEAGTWKLARVFSYGHALDAGVK